MRCNPVCLQCISLRFELGTHCFSFSLELCLHLFHEFIWQGVDDTLYEIDGVFDHIISTIPNFDKFVLRGVSYSIELFFGLFVFLLLLFGEGVPA